MSHIKPVIIPRADHPLSRKMVSPNAVRTLYRLRDNGFTAYLVGGCVRDLLLGREPKDFDLVTDATPGQIKKLFRNCRLVGRRFRLAHLHFGEEVLEVATFRSAVPEDDAGGEVPAPGDGAAKQERRPPRHLKSDEGMLLRDNVFGTPEEDALRRDFTVNALIYNIADFSIIDYVGGIIDLAAGVIRTIGDPEVRFTEDPVRMLRAVRFAAILGFSIENSTMKAITAKSDAIMMASAPRLYEELLKLFLQGEGAIGYQLLRRTGLFAALFPNFNAWLERETDGIPHIRVGKALEWIDNSIRIGVKIDPGLFLALMFGQYLEEKGERFRKGGANSQQAIDMAIAELLGEIMPFIQIPARVSGMIRHIIGMQHRFTKTPGRQPLSVIRRPGFADALGYLCATSEITGEKKKLCSWWQGYYQENLPTLEETAVSEKAVSKEGGKRPKRRRRRRKRQED